MTVNVLDSEIGVFESDSSNSDSLANHWPLNETRGTTGHDVEGSADLSLKSGITVNFNDFDNLPVYRFDGTSNAYAAIQSKNFNTSGGISAITVAAWVKVNDTTDEKIVVSFDRNEYFRLSVTSGNITKFSTTDSSGSTDDQSAGPNLDDDSYHLIAGVYDSSATNEKRIHVDDNQHSGTSPHSGNNLGTGTTRYGFIGANSEASSEDGTTGTPLFQFDGKMASVFIYDRALSASELTDIFNAGSVAVAPDFTVPSSDIKSIDAIQRIDDRRDAGRLVIDNNAGTYDSDSNEIQSGDLLRFRTKLEGESALTHQWSAMAETILYEELDHNRADLRIEATDFVFGVLSNRITENSYEGVNIVDIVDDVMSGEAPEIHTDRVQNITKTADAFPRGTNVLDFLNEMAGKANAVLSNRDRSLVFEKAEEAPFQFDLQASDRGTSIIRKEGETIVNQARVDGGETSSIDDQQTTQSSTTTVTDSSRITHQLSSRKSQIQHIDLYTSKTGSGESVIIRIQKDDGGSPVAVSDSESDVVSEEVSASDLTDGGLTTFRFPRDHNLIDPDPWMIIESDGSSGQDIGVDGSGNPRYDAYFRILISTLAISKESKEAHRLREWRIKRSNVRTRAAAEEVAKSKIRHSEEPDQFISFPAESKRMHNSKVGSIIGVSETNISGDCIITEKTMEYDGIKLQTEIEAQLVGTV